MDCNQQIDCLFETSWEVCNKIGGIYTVLSTKAKTLQELYKDKTIFIGPDVWSDETPSPYFIESAALLRRWREQAMLPEGVTVRVGRWNIPGKPIVVLVKFEAMYARKNEFYGHMWERFGVDSLHAYGDYDEACAFGHAAGTVIESLTGYFKANAPKGEPVRKIIAHFDEWTTGMGLLYVKDRMPDVATVFTTHATSIGRSICGNGKPLYDYLTAYDGDQMARELNMESKHSLEKAAAHAADIFTTVSDVTARECALLLGRRPEVETLNGFEAGFVPTKNKFKAARKAARAALLNVASALTGKAFDDGDTFIVATSGRCEYRNKGLDLFLDAMATLRARKPQRQVLAFVMVPAWCGGAREDLRQALAGQNGQGLTDAVLTHTLNNYNDDPVNRRIHDLGFAADVKGSGVNVIYVPCYLDGNDGIFNLTYYQLLIGMDATVFPSYYEPWGYTPLESVAFGVPTVTTSLSGFGQWVLSALGNTFSGCGVRVEERTDGNYDTVCRAIADDLTALLSAGKAERAAISAAALATAGQASWGNFITLYRQAYAQALAKHPARRGRPKKSAE